MSTFMTTWRDLRSRVQADNGTERVRCQQTQRLMVSLLEQCVADIPIDDARECLEDVRDFPEAEKILQGKRQLN